MTGSGNPVIENKQLQLSIDMIRRWRHRYSNRLAGGLITLAEHDAAQQRLDDAMQKAKRARNDA